LQDTSLITNEKGKLLLAERYWIDQFAIGETQ